MFRLRRMWLGRWLRLGRRLLPHQVTLLPSLSAVVVLQQRLRRLRF